MKKIFLFALITLNFFACSQKKITEGVLLQKQTMTSSNEQMNTRLKGIDPITTTIYFKGSASRAELLHPMMGESTTIIDTQKNKMMVLVNNAMAGKKYATKSIELSDDELKNITVKESTETKVILGYTCKKYDITLQDKGVTTKIIVFTTDKLNVPTKKNILYGNKVKGFPMLMEVTSIKMGSKMTITIETTEIKTQKVADAKFDMTNTEGFEKTDKIFGM